MSPPATLSAPSTAPPFARGLRGFYAFCRAIGVELAPFQRTLARAVYGAEREVVAVLPRGSAKTTTAALVGLHHLVVTPGASVSLGAPSREMASIAFAIMREAAEHPALADLVTARHLALRSSKGGVLRVVSGRGERAHGQTDTLMLCDELWAHPDGKLLEAFETALVKNPAARLVVISTAAASLDSPLGSLRTRALSLPEVKRDGAFLDCRGRGLRWLEWSVPEGRSLTVEEVTRANPAPWVTRALLAEQLERVSPLAWAQFHACRWGVGEAQWLPPGAWAACRGDVDPDERRIHLGIDVGGSRAASAVVGVTPELQVPVCEVRQGDEAVLEVTEIVRELAQRYTILTASYDPWRFRGEALRLEREGLRMIEFPQSHARLVPASENLHRVIVEKRLRHPGHRDLDRHVAAAVARATGRGWRLDKSAHDAQIDAVVALAMACEKAEHREPPARLLGWL